MRVPVRGALALSLLAPLGPGAARAESPDLAAALGRRVRTAEAQGQTWTVRVDRLDTGRTLYAHRADEPRVPSSTLKLFTTAAALHRLGPAFTVRTSVFATGPIADGVLHGDLVLYGRGDPNLSGRFHDDNVTAVLGALAAQVHRAGIRRVTGAVVGDGTYFEDRDFGPWEQADQHKWYAARVGALSFNDNCLDAYVGPAARAGRPARVRWEPVTRHVQFHASATTTTGRRRKLYAWRAPGSRTVAIGGSIGTAARIEPFAVALEQPALYAASVFHDVLRAAGVAVSGPARAVTRAAPRARSGGEREIARHVSEPLAEMLRIINGRSQNLHAELLCKILGREVGADGTWADGLAAIEAAVCELGVDMADVRLVDGSGLGRGNRATAAALVGVLDAMSRHDHAGVFEGSLVHVGVDANMTDLAQSVRYGELRVKSGSMKGVLGLAGYVRAPGRVPLAFALLGAASGRPDAIALRATRDRLAYDLVRSAPAR